jgi:Tfp pilus assembly protein PilO
MNLRGLQKFLIPIIAGVVFLVALAGIIWLWQKASADKADVQQQLEQEQQQLEGLRGQKPAPSTENMDALKRQREEIAKLYSRLQEGTTRPLFVATNLVRDIQFKQILGETADRLSKQAVRNAVKTPDNFLYGFSRYDAEFPCKQSGASADECKKTLALLGKQLLAIEKLAGLLMESHADDIVRIRRTEVDPGGSNPDVLDAPIFADPKGLYVQYPFEFEFTGDVKTLRTFLNSIANADEIFSVRTIKVDRTAGQITTGGSAVGSAGQPGAATEPARTIERSRISATVRVDLIEFNPPAPAPAPPAHKPPAPER